MEIMIKIPEEKYNMIKNKTYCAIYDVEVYEAISNGILLPKDHGNLIDIKNLRQDIIAHKYSNSFCEEHHIDQSINIGMLNILLADTQVIIKADRGDMK